LGRTAQPKEIKLLKQTHNSTRERQRGEPSYPPETQLVSYVETEDSYEMTLPMAPDYLSDAAKNLWDRLCAQLAMMRLFPNSVYEYVENYCRLYDIAEDAFDRYMKGEEATDSEGNTYTTKGNKDTFRIYKDAVNQMTVIGAKLAFTPADKTKVNTLLIDDKTKTKDKNRQKTIGTSG
jgi:P27 family predicted phage terminase small subunit